MTRYTYLTNNSEMSKYRTAIEASQPTDKQNIVEKGKAL